MVNLIHLENGNLKLVLTDAEELMDIMDRGQDERDALYDILERTGLIGNGWGVIYNAGMTEAPVIASDVDVDDDGKADVGNLWYYNEYMITSYLEELRVKGYVIFTAHEDNEKDEVEEEVFTFTRKEIINILDQFANCEEQGVMVDWKDMSRNSIEGWVDVHSQYWD